MTAASNIMLLRSPSITMKKPRLYVSVRILGIRLPSPSGSPMPSFSRSRIWANLVAERLTRMDGRRKRRSGTAILMRAFGLLSSKLLISSFGMRAGACTWLSSASKAALLWLPIAWATEPSVRSGECAKSSTMDWTMRCDGGVSRPQGGILWRVGLFVPSRLFTHQRTYLKSPLRDHMLSGAAT
jgi:hypothetical protein